MVIKQATFIMEEALTLEVITIKIIERNNTDSLVFLYKGSSEIAFNTELEFEGFSNPLKTI